MKNVPAFPSHGSMGEVAHEGITVRDYFAAKAMQALIAAQSRTTVSDQLGGIRGFRVVSEAAYQCADAMIAARSE